jgi:GST-like protein
MRATRPLAHRLSPQGGVSAVLPGAVEIALETRDSKYSDDMIDHILYGSQGSGSAAVEVALRQCGAAYRVIRASTWEPDSALVELEKVNPLRQIPTLVLPDGSVVTESAAILIHLGLAFPDSNLLPEQPSARAQCIRGLVFIAANCYSALSVNDHPERWTTATTKAAQDKVRQGARSQLHRNWGVFADTFSATPYLSGSKPGALDFLTAVVSKWAGTRAFVAQHHPEFAALLRRIEGHDAVGAVFRDHWGA